MNSKSAETQIDELDSILQSALKFNSDEEKLQFEAEMLHLNTMKIVEKLMIDHNMNKKDLALKLDSSPSYITQLFTADKLINYKTLAKLQRIFNVNFSFDYNYWPVSEFEEIKEFQLPEAKIIPLFDLSKKEKGYKSYILSSSSVLASANGY
jgi:hypothetical protein